MTPDLLPLISKLELSRISKRAASDLKAFIRNHLQIIVGDDDVRLEHAQEFLKQLDHIFDPKKEKSNGSSEA